MSRRLEVILSPYTGYCFGVKRAMRLIEEGLEREGGAIRSIGHVIHNPQAVERLRSRGVIPVSSMDEIETGQTLVVRAHGVDPDIVSEARRRGIRLIDATCPFVRRSQNYVRRIAQEGRRVIIIGDRNHPEVRGISGRAGGDFLILATQAEALDLPPIESAGVVVQTTFSREKALEIIARLEERIADLRVHDTICQATMLRSEATLALARSVDMVLVVGGRESANTRRLYQMCMDLGVGTHFIETAEEIDPAWFHGCRRIGLTTGTSTPDWITDEVIERLEQISQTDCGCRDEQNGLK